MRTWKGLRVVALCTMAVVLFASGAAAATATLLGVSKGQMPGDTSADPQLAFEQKAELGGNALKVVFTQGSSFGETRPKITNWTPYKAIQFDAFNPSQAILSVTLTVKHKGTTSYPTRIDVPVMLKPGKSSIELALADMANVDGSRPDLSFVKHWYVSCDTAGATAYFGDFSLVGEGAAAATPTPAAAPVATPAVPAAAAPSQAIRVTGHVGTVEVDLTITGLTLSGLTSSIAPAATTVQPAAAPAPAPAAGAKATLLAVSKGTIPNDTNGDAKIDLAENAELGGICLKATLAPGASFGMSRAGLKDWRGFSTLKFSAFNPGNAPLAVSFTVKHAGSKSFDTRVDKAITLAPGKNEISIPVAGLANNDGSAADLSSVRQWYIASEAAVTAFFGDFVLEAGK